MKTVTEIINQMPEGEMKALLMQFLNYTGRLEKRIDQLERKKISQGKGLNEEQYVIYLKEQFPDIDVDGEIHKMGVWCNAHNRIVTRKFMANWLIKARPETIKKRSVLDD